MSLLLNLKKNKDMDNEAKLKAVINIYNVESSKMKPSTDKKQQFRDFCTIYLEMIRQIPTPKIQKQSRFECVLVEFRILPHLEFLIRNSIIKLGTEWSHTIVCGIENFEFLSSICSTISENIRLIKLNVCNVNVSEYSNLLCSTEFWNLFHGDKILLYQEDTCLFQSNIHEFLKWDYIGASWPAHSNHNVKNVGNGGFSLRTRQSMLDVIKTKPHTDYGDIAEDVYFTKVLIEQNLGIVANVEAADLFSTEYKFHPHCLGSHCFFLYNPYWKQILFQKVIVPYIQIFLNM